MQRITAGAAHDAETALIALGKKAPAVAIQVAARSINWVDESNRAGLLSAKLLGYRRLVGQTPWEPAYPVAAVLFTRKEWGPHVKRVDLVHLSRDLGDREWVVSLRPIECDGERVGELPTDIEQALQCTERHKDAL